MPRADDLDEARDSLAETLDEIEERVDPRVRWQDVVARVRKLADEQPIPVAAIAVAGTAVVALGVVVLYRIVRH
jgi:type VI protein secretion system component VasF